MADNDRLSTLHSVQLSGTTKSWADALNDNFAELDERKTDIGDTSTLVHDGSYVHTNDSTITIQKNGATVDSFTTNAASGKSINIVVPTTPQDIGADPAGTASSAVSTHDASSSAHSDIRSAVSTAQQKADDAYSLAEGREKAVAYNNYSAAVTAFNAEASSVLKIGDNVYIKTVEVPDLWVYDVLGSKVTYTYTTDAAIVSAIQTNGYVDIGWYRLAQLETSKVDLSGYVPNTRKVNNKALSSDITLDASDVGALASSTKYGASLSVNGRSVQLKDQDGNNLGTAIQTQDTTYGLATAGGSGLSAFAAGDTIENGGKIHFDTTKGSELGTYLAGLGLSVGRTSSFIEATEFSGSPLLYAFKLPDGGSGNSNLLCCVSDDPNGMTIIYADTAGEYSQYGMSWSAGFQNLDANDDYAVELTNQGVSSITISAINDTTPATWNGVIIGKSGGASSGTDGLMSSTDKGKLDGISAGANKVEASTTNGNIKIDGVETTVYTLPAIDQVTEYSFTDSDAGWGALTNGVYTLTITSTKRPIICYNSNGEQVMVTIAYTGSAITVKSDTKFAGKVLAI